jgi:hypothetical protein
MGMNEFDKGRESFVKILKLSHALSANLPHGDGGARPPSTVTSLLSTSSDLPPIRSSLGGMQGYRTIITLE